MKICLVATFPPSGRQLNEYAFHLARELACNPDIELTILADQLTDYDFATDENGRPLKISQQPATKNLPSRSQRVVAKFTNLRSSQFSSISITLSFSRLPLAR